MIFKRLIFSTLFLCVCISLLAQKTTIFTEADLTYKQGIHFFENGLYGKAQHEFEKTIDLLRPINNPEKDDLQMMAKLHIAKSAVRMNLPDGEKLILDFVRQYSPDPRASEAVIEAGNYYYNAKEYDQAYLFYSMIDRQTLTVEQQSEVMFKKGYALFVKKKFKQAQSLFNPVKDFKNKYYYPTNYYLGMTYFFDGDYSKAIEYYQRVEASKKYKNFIPYYVCQIYFSQNKFDELINYAIPQLENNTVRNRKEINQLVGQTLFEQGQYDKALPFLENAEEGKMRQEDFYQLGYAQYQAQRYEAAIVNLSELSQLDEPLGQHSQYILGDCYIQTGDKNSARTAFLTASRMSFDPIMQKEAFWNYAKLSYELGYDGEAIDALQKIDPQSEHYAEAQDIMSNIFLNSRDYEKAMQIIEAIPTQTPKLREAYQKVSYNRGVQLYEENRIIEAKGYFSRSLKVPTDNRTKALAHYWLGELSHAEGKYSDSNRQLNLFMSAARGLSNLPDESSVHTGNYTMGYNYLKQGEYSAALGHFRDAVSGIKQNASYIEDEYVKNQILGDATMRVGDCYFEANNYAEAIKYYNEAINRQYTGYIYAIYQKAIIEGLQNNTTNKIIALERIVEEFPESDYADNTLLELGTTYQEMGKLQEAAKPLSNLVENYPNSILRNKALNRLGLIAYNQGSYNKAINNYKEIFENNPEEEDAQIALAALKEIYVDNLSKPNEYFDFLSTIGYEVDNEQKESISFQAAESQFENGNYPRAIEGYKEYLAQYPNGPYSLQATYTIAESYAAQSDLSNALVYYEQVIEKKQSVYLVKALNKAALIAYNQNEDFTKSFQYFSQLEMVANSEDTRFDAQLGALRSAYRIDNTTAVYDMANKVINNPKASKDQVAAANFYLGKMAFDKKDFDKALIAFNEVVRNSDNEQTAESRYLVAYIYYEQRELDTAKNICNSSRKESSSYPFWVAKSIILLADILVEQNELRNAKVAYEVIIQRFPQFPELTKESEIKLIEVTRLLEVTSRIKEEPTNGELEMMEEGENN